MRLLTRRLLVVIIVVGGILAATGIYMSSHPMVQEASGSVGSIAPEEEETIVIPEDTNNLTQNYTIPSQVLFKGKTYTVIKKDLKFIGPETPVCPYCSSNSTTQTGSSTQGNYWFYYYHCYTCNRNFATYASQ